MILTIRWFFYFVMSLIGLIPMMIKTESMERRGEIEKKDEMVSREVIKWMKKRMELSKSTVEVEGLENVPKDEAVLFVSNHQGYFDIPLLVGYIDKPKGFLAKYEVRRFPLISTWMKNMYCVFIERDSIGGTLQSIKRSVDNINKGHSMLVFPEGSRSVDGTLGDFKSGAFRIATRTGKKIVPVTLIGSHKIMEKGSIRITPAAVKVKIAPPIEMTEEYKKNINLLSEDVRKVIESNLEYEKEELSEVKTI